MKDYRRGEAKRDPEIYCYDWLMKRWSERLDHFEQTRAKLNRTGYLEKGKGKKGKGKGKDKDDARDAANAFPASCKRRRAEANAAGRFPTFAVRQTSY